MNFLPVLGRELRVTSRSRRLYWGRFLAALLAVGLVSWFWWTVSVGVSSAQRAQLIFGSVATLAFIYCLFLGAYVTADSISEERREGTLGLLFLTNLKSYDVVVGKSAAGTLRAFYTLIAIFPVLTIPILLGGLTGKMVVRMVLVLVNTLFFSLMVGLVISAISKHDRKAQVSAFVTMLVLTLAVPGVLIFLKEKYGLKFSDAWFGISPGTAFVTAFDKSYAKDPKVFWISVWIPHVLGWCAFLAAALIVRGIWQDKPEASDRLGWWNRFKKWVRGSAETRAAYRERLLNLSPYYWLAARDRLKPFYVGLFLGGCAAFWLFLWTQNPRDMLEQEAFFISAIFLHLTFKLWMATEAGRQLFEDRKNSALELTLSTPLPVREILEGQFLALVRQFGWAVGLVLLCDVAAMIAGARTRLYGAEAEWVLSWVAIMITLVADCVTIAAVGMWLGLTSRRASRAIVQTLLYVMALPWGILIALFTYMAVIRFSRMESLSFFIGAYFIVSLVTDLVLFLWTSGNLTSRFRAVAVQRFDSRSRDL